MQIAGSIVVYDDVAKTLKEDRHHILRAHIKSIQGPYVKGDVIHIYDEDGEEIARGLTNFTSEETMALAKNLDMPPPQLLGYSTGGTIVSRENLVVLNDRHLLWEGPDKDALLEVGN